MPRSVVLLSYSGCLIPLLLVLNSLFGWILLSFKYWLLSEAVLLLLLVFNSFIFTRRAFSGSRQQRRSDVIDVEGEVVDGKEEPKKSLNN
ncbi:MAG: hypothetical protein WC469_04535 [Candidatus Omnitrophota bacterium]|jgi:uncharacterized membrane protein YcgQ (UPF0703/DUF1980 family)